MSQQSRYLKIAYTLLACIALFGSSALAAGEPSSAPSAAELAARRELVAAVFEWINATNARDFDAQDKFYPDKMDAFYLWRDVSRAAVLEEKRRVFRSAETIDIKADAPQIIVEPGGQSARMYFRKSYRIDGSRRNRSGEVLQELRWEKQPEGWKIVSERDLRVIRHARR
jgi:ketosteroid isomerase-like protein